MDEGNKRNDLYPDYSGKGIRKMLEFENKQRILHFLVAAIQQTRAGEDLLDLTISEDKETVRAEFEGGIKIINVACDSGFQMIKDVVNNLHIG